MAKQQTFAGLAWQQKGKTTRRERFLAEMEAIIPWNPGDLTERDRSFCAGVDSDARR